MQSAAVADVSEEYAEYEDDQDAPAAAAKPAAPAPARPAAPAPARGRAPSPLAPRPPAKVAAAPAKAPAPQVNTLAVTLA